MEATKRCSKCGEIKVLAEFGKFKRTRDGYNTRCKACCNADQRARREANPEKARECERRYQEAHPERVKEAAHRFRKAHPEKKREERRHYCAAHPERIREQSRRYHEANPEKARERKRRRREAHPEKQREYDHERYVANPQRERERVRRYQREHPEVKRRSEKHRRARKKNAPGTYKSDDVEQQLLVQDGLCFWCSELLQPGWQIDHVIPISRNGSNWAENIVCACRRCNASKNDRIPFVEWKPPAPLKQAHEIPVLVQWMEEHNLL